MYAPWTPPAAGWFPRCPPVFPAVAARLSHGARLPAVRPGDHRSGEL